MKNNQANFESKFAKEEAVIQSIFINNVIGSEVDTMG